MKFEEILNVIFFIIILFFVVCGYSAIVQEHPIIANILAILGGIGFLNFVGTITLKKRD